MIIEERLCILFKIQYDSKSSGMVNDLKVFQISQVVPTVLGSVTMTVLKLEFSHWWFLLLIDIQALFEAIWGFDRTKPGLDSHELITFLNILLYK